MLLALKFGFLGASLKSKTPGGGGNIEVIVSSFVLKLILTDWQQ